MDTCDPIPAELLALGSRLREILDIVPREEREALLASGKLATVPYGTVVLPEGSRSDHIGYVIEGALGMQKTLPDGRTHLIGLLVPTDMYGRLFDGGLAHDLVALADSTVFTFGRDPFEAALNAAPEVERKFLVSLLDELDAAREWVLLLGGHRVTERVASFLLVVLRRSMRDQGATVDESTDPVVRIPIRRSDLAHHLGARPESVSRALHDLQDRGIVDLIDPYTVRIRDVAKLVEVSGADLVV
jgi:CRP/FNR family transcriptional regulator